MTSPKSPIPRGGPSESRGDPPPIPGTWRAGAADSVNEWSVPKPPAPPRRRHAPPSRRRPGVARRGPWQDGGACEARSGARPAATPGGADARRERPIARLKSAVVLAVAAFLGACAPDPDGPASQGGRAFIPGVSYEGGHPTEPSRGYAPPLAPGYVPPPAPYTSPDSGGLAPGVGLGVYRPDWTRRERDRRDQDLRRERETREDVNRDRRRQDYERREQDHRRYEGTLGRY